MVLHLPASGPMVQFSTTSLHQQMNGKWHFHSHLLEKSSKSNSILDQKTIKMILLKTV